jgi:hypothetical protein
MIWFSRRTAARVLEISALEVQLLARVGVLRVRRGAVLVPRDERARRAAVRQLSTVGAW